MERPIPSVYNLDSSDEIPPDAVYVGRPTKFGNPFPIGPDATRQQVIEAYREWLDATESGRATAAAAARELEGRDLTCHCAPQACHADILLGIANPGGGRAEDIPRC